MENNALKCSSCGFQILNQEKRHTVNGRDFCDEHINCARCNADIRLEKCHYDDLSLCRQCLVLIANKQVCRTCMGPVEGEPYRRENAVWHSTCFLCRVCRVDLRGKDYTMANGVPHCARHACHSVELD